MILRNRPLYVRHAPERDRTRERVSRRDGSLPLFEFPMFTEILYVLEVDGIWVLHRKRLDEKSPTAGGPRHFALAIEGVMPRDREEILQALWAEMPDADEVHVLLHNDDEPLYGDVMAFFAVKFPKELTLTWKVQF